jgi:UDP-GlcNAc:undecaprenyl-phosphate GlcNAc-1-phosphate transferase
LRSTPTFWSQSTENGNSYCLISNFMKTYAVVYFLSAYLALFINPLVIRLARRLKAVDIPDVRKVHSRSIPRIGGVAIFASAVCAILPVLFLQNVIGDRFRDILTKLAVLLSASTFIFLVGLVDDIRDLGAKLKLLAQLVATIAVCAVGIRIESVSVGDWITFDFGLFSWPLTIIWIIGITNAVNLSDGLDGLAAGISAVACAVIAVFAIYSDSVVMAVLMLALLGSLTSFLFFNFNPAKVFMGDCGSLFLGFMISGASVMCSAKSSALVGLALPVVALGIPIFDTLFSIVRRFLERRSIFAPDRSHFHHRLLEMGLTQRYVVITAYAVTLMASALGLFMMLSHNEVSIILFLCILLFLILLFRVVGVVRLRETIAGLQKKWVRTRQKSDQARRFERAQLYLRQAHSRDDWWPAVCKAAQLMDFAWLSLKTTNKDGTTHTSVWRGGDVTPDLSQVMIINLPVSNGQPDASIELEIAVPVDGALETASRQAMLFSRLIDDHNVFLAPS